MFSQACVIPSIHGGGGGGVSQHAMAQGRVCIPACRGMSAQRVGVCLEGVPEGVSAQWRVSTRGGGVSTTHPPFPEMATEVGGTHPTGMYILVPVSLHSAYVSCMHFIVNISIINTIPK